MNWENFVYLISWEAGEKHNTISRFLQNQEQKGGNNQKKAAVKKRQGWKKEEEEELLETSVSRQGRRRDGPPTPFSQKLWKRKGGTLIEEGLAINFLRVLTKEREGESHRSPPSFLLCFSRKRNRIESPFSPFVFFPDRNYRFLQKAHLFKKKNSPDFDLLREPVLVAVERDQHRGDLLQKKEKRREEKH